MAEKNVRGSIQEATDEGFAKLLVDANRAHEQGLVLVGVVNIGKTKIGGIFVRMPRPEARGNASLIGD